MTTLKEGGVLSDPIWQPVNTYNAIISILNYL